MINLLAEEKSRKVQGLFRDRVIVLSLLFLNTAIFLSLVALFPSYIFVVSRKEINNAQLKALQNIAVSGDTETFQKMASLSSLEIKILKGIKDEPSFSRIISQILLLKPQGISVQGIVYHQPDGGTLSLRGTARDRSDALLFLSNLKKTEAFSAADIPLSNLIKEKDFTFTLTVTLKGKAKGT